MASNESSGKKEKDLSIGDAIKKVVSIGVGAAFMTEDAVRSALKDLPLPTDIINGLIQNAKSAKVDFTDGVREEVRNYLLKVDPKKIVEDLVQDYDINVNATFSFTKKEENKSTNDESKDN